MKKQEKVVFIVGPTCVGKTGLAISLAKKINGEIISSDSMQAYRKMDVISQKPTKKERRAIQHHLVGFLDPSEEYSAAEFINKATSLIKRILAKRKIPIVVGGSGLYVKALIDGLFPAPKKDARLRKTLEADAEKNGAIVLYEELKRVDPETASKIHPNDLRRIIRALEIYRLTGVNVSDHKKSTVGIKSLFAIEMFGLTMAKKTLHGRIEERTDKMFSDGIVEEVRALRKASPSITAKAALGYKEVEGYLDGSYSLEEAIELLKKSTMRLTKKQMTWFRADKRIKWIDLDKATENKVLEFIEREVKA